MDYYVISLFVWGVLCSKIITKWSSCQLLIIWRFVWLIFKMQNTAVAKSAYNIHSPPSNLFFSFHFYDIDMPFNSFFFLPFELFTASPIWLIMKDVPIRHWICLVACLHNSIFHNILHCLMFRWFEASDLHCEQPKKKEKKKSKF